MAKEFGKLQYGLNLFSYLIDHPAPAPKARFISTKDGKILGLEELSDSAKLVPRLKRVSNDSEAKQFFDSSPALQECESLVKPDLITARSYLSFLRNWSTLARARDLNKLSPLMNYLMFDKVRASGIKSKSAIGAKFLFVIDERNFSAAEVVPAVLSFAGQAQLVGKTTAGAGCDMFTINAEHLLPAKLDQTKFSAENQERLKESFNKFDIEEITFSKSIIYLRKNGAWASYENEGIRPDVFFEQSASDLQCNESLKRLLLELLTNYDQQNTSRANRRG